MTTLLSAETAMFGHTSEDTAVVVDNYPYGRLRTQIRYWMETTKNGDRFVSQTLNPKTGRWNKPKKSTYVAVGCMYRNPENGHVEWTGLHVHAKPENVEHFLSVTAEHLSKMQKVQVAYIKGVARAYKNVTFTISEGQMSEDKKTEQANIQATVNLEVRRETANALRELA